MRLPPEMIEKIRERERDQREGPPSLELPLPEIIRPKVDESNDVEEVTSRVIVIDLA